MYGKLSKIFTKFDDVADAAGKKQKANRVMSFGKETIGRKRA